MRVTIKSKPETREFRVFFTDTPMPRQEDSAYYATDYADAVGTAQHMAGAGGAIIDRTRISQRNYVVCALTGKTVAIIGYGMCERASDGTLTVHTSYWVTTPDQLPAARRFALADVLRLNGIAP